MPLLARLDQSNYLSYLTPNPVGKKQEVQLIHASIITRLVNIKSSIRIFHTSIMKRPKRRGKKAAF
jgi:hypothetical protein